MKGDLRPMRDEALFGQIFVSIAQMVHQALNIDSLGLSSLKILIVMTVYSNPGISMSRLAESVGISNAQLSRAITQLEAADLVHRVRNPKNRRVVNVYRTDAGDVLVKSQVDLVLKHVEESLKPLSNDDRAQLRQHLTGVIALLQKADIFVPKDLDTPHDPPFSLPENDKAE